MSHSIKVCKRSGFFQRQGLLADLGIVLGGCAHLPKSTIHTSIDIEAPPELVWEILTDIEHPPEWNPYHVSVKGELAVDQPLTVRIEKLNGKDVEIHPHVMRTAALTELTWGAAFTASSLGNMFST